MSKPITAIILEGKVYIADHTAALCANCDILERCCEVYDDEEWCLKLGATKDYNFGLRFSQELTDKLNRN